MNNNNELQINDIIESLKGMIADQAYQIAYKDAIIAAQSRQLKEYADIILNQNAQGAEVNNDDVR